MSIDYSNDLSAAKDLTLTILTIVSSTLSVAGSSIIISSVIRRRKNRGVCERLLFGMSVCDIFASVDFAVQPFLTPVGKWRASRGNATTCNIAGAFFQFGALASMIYYNMLAIFYFLTIRLGLDPKVIAKWCEPWMHAIPVLWPAMSAIIGLGLTSYEPTYGPLWLYQGCWFGGNSADLISWVTVGPWLLTSYTVIPVIFIIIHRSVRQAYRGSLLNQFAESNLDSASITRNGSRRNMTSILLRASSSRGSRRSSLFARNSWEGAEFTSTSQGKRLRMLAWQAFLYVLAFYATYSFLFAGQIVEGYSDTPGDLVVPLYPLLVLQAIMSPLAGFFNSLVYLRPRFSRLRENRRDQSGSKVFRVMNNIRFLISGGSQAEPVEAECSEPSNNDDHRCTTEEGRAATPSGHLSSTHGVEYLSQSFKEAVEASSRFMIPVDGASEFGRRSFQCFDASEAKKASLCSKALENVIGGKSEFAEEDTGGMVAFALPEPKQGDANRVTSLGDEESFGREDCNSDTVVDVSTSLEQVNRETVSNMKDSSLEAITTHEIIFEEASDLESSQDAVSVGESVEDAQRMACYDSS